MIDMTVPLDAFLLMESQLAADYSASIAIRQLHTTPRIFRIVEEPLCRLATRGALR
jgi:hypothetical protein